MRKIEKTKLFERRLKKLHPNEKSILDGVVKTIIENPEQGDMKRGNLAGVRTVSFKMHGGEFRLMYQFDCAAITLLRFGPRENFYD
jgi:mRNA-degrading endonuclease RelE of RelBE toxin-antitoxin system